ncbi:MAG: hypothetical protein K8R39_09090 [Arcobacteraceae bacterium]|nr:hypothetical protein [Arcobacteraceae bacterium]
MRWILGVLFLINTLFANENLTSLYDNVILKNSKQSIEDIRVFQEHIKQNNFNMVNDDFKNIVKSWKSVEAFYILGDLDDNYLDTPRYLDTFHQGNEDIKEQLDLIIASSEDLKISLYKNSHKTINALEYILFTKNLQNQRIKDITLIILQTMETNLHDIYNGYLEQKEKFLKDEITANAIILNSLSENSYKITEWRVGDTAGFTKKYEDKPDNSRAEYSISKNSVLAIQSILETHKTILDIQSFKNFGDTLKSYGATKVLEETTTYLNSALKSANHIKNDDLTNTKELYENLKKLHIAYYISLIDELKVTAKILDADGD